jgi:hypothetical protein
MPHIFISYVRDDATIVAYITKILKANNLDIWVDTDRLQPGLRWKEQIRENIQSGNKFIALFSKQWLARDATYANEEIATAIEELRRRPTNRSWFIPVSLDGCDIPNSPISSFESLRDLQFIDLSKMRWSEGIRSILTALEVSNPQLEPGEPLGAGLPQSINIIGGQLFYESTPADIPHLKNMVVQITGGIVSRFMSDRIQARISTYAPYQPLQRVNHQLGFDLLTAITDDLYLSRVSDRPTKFISNRKFELQKWLHNFGR